MGKMGLTSERVLRVKGLEKGLRYGGELPKFLGEIPPQRIRRGYNTPWRFWTPDEFGKKPPFKGGAFWRELLPKIFFGGEGPPLGKSTLGGRLGTKRFSPTLSGGGCFFPPGGIILTKGVCFPPPKIVFIFCVAANKKKRPRV